MSNLPQRSRLEHRQPYRPFCSKRCKLIDLGEWAQEKYTVSSEDDPFSDLLDGK
ncbi:zinc-binding protein YacG [Neisseria meningitidis]|nr:zinc-binding protein YacG [Neisseria meningitidis]